MLNAGVEGLGRRVLCETEDVATADAGQPACPGDQQEAQSPHTAHDVGVGPLARAAPWGGAGVELEAAGEIVGEDAELLPGAVGPVVTGWEDIDCEVTLEVRDRLLLRAQSTDEV